MLKRSALPSFRFAALGAGFLQIRQVSRGATPLAIASSGAMPEFRAPEYALEEMERLIQGMK
jgi:hypothetical protein